MHLICFMLFCFDSIILILKKLKVGHFRKIFIILDKIGWSITEVTKNGNPLAIQEQVIQIDGAYH